MAGLRDRPLIISDIDMSTGCPVSRPQPVSGTRGVQALGGEPLWAGGLRSVTPVPDADEAGSAPPDLEVVWFSTPDYRGPLLLRGLEIATGEAVHFRADGGEPVAELWLDDSTSVDLVEVGPEFRSWESRIALPSRGCYGIQVEAIGHIGSYVIVFEVR